MAVGKNIVANIVGRVWSLVSIYIFVPIYINLLGVENYGVISFYALLLTLLAFADAGLTATLNREFAKAGSEGSDYRQNLLRTFEFVYLFISVFIIGFVFFTAPYIVKYFVKSDTIPVESLVHHIRIMGVIIAFYLFSSLYNGGLVGLQKQVLSNILAIIYGIVRSALVIIPLYWIRNLDFYFYWQLFAVIVYFYFLRHYLVKSIRVNLPTRSNFLYLKNVWRYALGMMAMAVIYAINTQIDKLSISNLLSLTYFSYYSLASMIGQGVLILAMPIGVAFFPELTRIITSKETEKAKMFFHQFAYIIAAITSSLAVIIVFYAHDYILIWTHDIIIANAISSTTILLTLGAMFMSVQLCPYYLALANGHTKTNVVMGIICIIFIIPSLQFLIPKFGLLGAAIPWLVVNFSVTILLGYIIIQKFMKGEFIKWLVFDSFTPVLISFGVGILFSSLFKFFPSGFYSVLYGFIIVLISFSVNGYIFYRRYPETLQLSIISKFLKRKS